MSSEEKVTPIISESDLRDALNGSQGERMKRVAERIRSIKEHEADFSSPEEMDRLRLTLDEVDRRMETFEAVNGRAPTQAEQMNILQTVRSDEEEGFIDKGKESPRDGSDGVYE